MIEKGTRVVVVWLKREREREKGYHQSSKRSAKRFKTKNALKKKKANKRGGTKHAKAAAPHRKKKK